MLHLIERCLEKYLKKLIGRTDLEDALKRLDKLTHEEAWMGIAQNLRATHFVSENVRRIVDDVDQVKRLLSDFITANYRALPILQGTNCGKAFTNGSPHPIPQRIITLHAVLITRRQHLGSFKAASFRSGSQPAHFFGFTENVRAVVFLT